MPVSLPSSGVSINPGGTSLIPSTLDLPAQGVALNVGVSITGGGGGSPALTTTFDPANKALNVALSGGNLVVTTTSSASVASTARSISSHSTGKYYCECTLTNSTGGGGLCGFGVANTSFVPSGPSFLGQTNTAAAFWDDGRVIYNGGVAGTISTYTTGDVICMAIDTTARLVWWRKNGGNWNNNASGNPATGTIGIDISAVTGALFATTEADIINAVWTANFGASAYAQTPPSGYGNW